MKVREKMDDILGIIGLTSLLLFFFIAVMCY